ncbi:MAG TPA: hypothetical protein VGD23_12615 [Sphingomicrobium sp.]
MATFQITGPDGKKYRVTGDSPAGAMQALRKMVNTPAQQHPEFDGSNIPGYNPETGMVERQFSKGESGAYGAADMATFGFGDEIASWIGSFLPGVDKPQEQILSEMRGNQKAAQEQNPGSYLTGQVAGGVAQGLAAGPGIMASAPSLGGRVLGGMGTGGLMGGAYGVGSGEGTQDRVISGLTGAGTGAALGGAFPLVSTGVSSAVRSGLNAMSGNRAAAQTGVSPGAMRMLAGTLQADDTLGATGRQNMARAGQDAMLADAGPRARGVLDVAIQRGGQGGVGARRAIDDRVGRASHAITRTLDDTLGAPQGVTATRTGIREGSAAARGNAYDNAYRQAIDYADPRGQRLEQLVRNRVPHSAIQRANALMRAEGNQSQQILARVGDDGSVTFERLPDVRQLDYITRGLNDLAEAGEGAGALGGQNALGRAYQGLSREIRDTLRGMVPEYGQALETAADPIRRSQAVQLGSRLLSMPRDEAAEAVRGMTGAERQAAAQGLRSKIDDAMSRVTRTVQDGNTDAREAIKALKDLSSRQARENVTSLLGRDAANRLFTEIDRATTAFDLRASVAENSKTFARGAIDDLVKRQTSSGVVGQALEGKPIGAGKRLIQSVTGRTPEALAAREDQIYAELADVLTRSPGQSGGLFNAISDLGQSDAANQLLAGRVRGILGALQQPTAYPTGGLLQDMRRR